MEKKEEEVETVVGISSNSQCFLYHRQPYTTLLSAISVALNNQSNYVDNVFLWRNGGKKKNNNNSAKLEVKIVIEFHGHRCGMIDV